MADVKENIKAINNLLVIANMKLGDTKRYKGQNIENIYQFLLIDKSASKEAIEDSINASSKFFLSVQSVKLWSNIAKEFGETQEAISDVLLNPENRKEYDRTLSPPEKQDNKKENNQIIPTKKRNKFIKFGVLISLIIIIIAGIIYEVIIAQNSNNPSQMSQNMSQNIVKSQNNNAPAPPLVSPQNNNAPAPPLVSPQNNNNTIIKPKKIIQNNIERLPKQPARQINAKPRQTAAPITPNVPNGRIFKETGFQILKMSGCLYCHKIYNKGPANGNDLSHIGSKLKLSQIENKIVHSTGGSMPPNTNMPKQEVYQIAYWLENLK